MKPKVDVGHAQYHSVRYQLGYLSAEIGPGSPDQQADNHRTHCKIPIKDFLSHPKVILLVELNGLVGLSNTADKCVLIFLREGFLGLDETYTGFMIDQRNRSCQLDDSLFHLLLL